MAPTFFYCKWCGSSLEEIVEIDKPECDGHLGVYHIKYLRKKQEFYSIINPILKRVLK
jgi:hypothetical protein